MGKIKFSTRQSIYGVLFILPSMLILAALMLYPLIQTFVFSFSTLTLPKFDVKFNGFSNFTRIFSRMEVPQIIFNTIVWTLGAVIMRITFGMLTALVMNANVPGIKVLRVIVLIPWTVPSIVAANSWRWIYQGDFGVINGMLKSWGLTPYPWIGSVDTAMGAILVASTWAGYPFVMMMLLAAMQGLSQDHFEAAMVDGANAIQRFWHITLPGIKPVIVVLIALETINAINSFDMIFNLTGGGPGNATEIIGLFIYRIGFTLLDFAGASAVSVVLILVALMLFVVYVVLQQAAGKSGEIKG